MKLVSVLFMAVVLACPSYSARDPQEKPELLKRVNPEYPKVLLLAGVEGEVYVRATINEQGKVENAVVTRATDNRFNDAALDALRQWMFKPAMLDGKPIKTEVTIPFKFALGDASLPPGKLVTLREKITRFLTGGTAAELLPEIDSSAYSILGGDYGLLSGFLRENTKAEKFGGGHDTEILFSRLKTDAKSTAALLTVETQMGKLKRWHTILCMEQADGTWRIADWHVSP